LFSGQGGTNFKGVGRKSAQELTFSQDAAGCSYPKENRRKRTTSSYIHGLVLRAKRRKNSKKGGRHYGKSWKKLNWRGRECAEKIEMLKMERRMGKPLHSQKEDPKVIGRKDLQRKS